MKQHRLPSDVIGLANVMPPLSRRIFMSTTAAAAAGYTLAAGRCAPTSSTPTPMGSMPAPPA